MTTIVCAVCAVRSQNDYIEQNNRSIRLHNEAYEGQQPCSLLQVAHFFSFFSEWQFLFSFAVIISTVVAAAWVMGSHLRNGKGDEADFEVPVSVYARRAQLLMARRKT